jgi:hypothetical protein
VREWRGKVESTVAVINAQVRVYYDLTMVCVLCNDDAMHCKQADERAVRVLSIWKTKFQEAIAAYESIRLITLCIL